MFEFEVANFLPFFVEILISWDQWTQIENKSFKILLKLVFRKVWLLWIFLRNVLSMMRESSYTHALENITAMGSSFRNFDGHKHAMPSCKESKTFFF